MSRVLAGNPRVHAELRERVLAAVEELNYRPNRVARSLRVQQSSTIGLIISDIQNPFFTSVVRAVEDVAYRHGYSIFLCNSDEDPEKERLYLNLMRDENVGGIIVTPAREKNAALDGDVVAQTPMVMLDRRMVDVEADAVLTDNLEAAYRLVSHLIANGHRRIGAIVGEADITTGRERMAGYVRALQDHGIERTPALAIQVIPKERNGAEAAARLLALPEPPTAIFTGNNLLTLGALQAIRDRGLTIPDDVALAGFDDMPWNALLRPGITAVEQPTYELGRTAAELLLDRIKNPSRPFREVILRGRVIVRESCGFPSKERV